MIFGIRISAIIETLLFLAVATVLDYYWGSKDSFINVYPHPFWFIVIVVSAQYGLAEGFMAAFLSTIFLYAKNFPTMQWHENIFDYETRIVTLPLLWFFMAFVIGMIRSHSQNNFEQIKSELERTKKEANQITEAYHSLKETKDNLEYRLSSQEKTPAAIYQTFKALENLNPAKIITDSKEIIIAALNPKKFSVYAFGPNGFEAVISHGWESTATYPRRITQTDPLYHELVDKQRMVCAINSEDAAILGNQGVIAAPIIDSDDNEIIGMIKIEEMEFRELNLSNLASFNAICELIGCAYSRAKKYQNITVGTRGK